MPHQAAEERAGAGAAADVTVDSTFLILCVVPKWENSSRAVSFQLERAGRIIDRVSVKGVPRTRAAVFRFLSRGPCQKRWHWQAANAERRKERA